MTKPIIFWFRQDLRLGDNPALTAAVKSNSPIVPVYIFDETAPGKWAPGGASCWWLHQSLEKLSADLRTCGADLILKRGKTLDLLTTLVQKTSAHSVYFSRCYEPYAVKLEKDLITALEKHQVSCKRFSSGLLFEPEEIRNKSGEPFRVFTPFWKSCLTKEEPKKPIAKIKKLTKCATKVASETLADWHLVPTQPDWAVGLRERWVPGEKGAQARLRQFMKEAMSHYKTNRDLPAIEGTSRLSPYLHFGEISPRQCWHAVKTFIEAGNGKASIGGESFLRELGWREFSSHLLFYWPDLPSKAFRPEFSKFPWAGKKKHLTAWQKGMTGYPIVDAGMRELWHTGWMHNRVRMIVASFLIKDLLISWQDGEDWFWDTLVDADLANNAAGWQWVAGSGADAAPYFRIFNPVLQSKKFDPDGVYIRKWVPEISKLSDKDIHAPWEVSPLELELAKVKLGDTYPCPIVDHGKARDKALEIFQMLKKQKANV